MTQDLHPTDVLALQLPAQTLDTLTKRMEAAEARIALLESQVTILDDRASLISEDAVDSYRAHLKLDHHLEEQRVWSQARRQWVRVAVRAIDGLASTEARTAGARVKRNGPQAE